MLRALHFLKESFSELLFPKVCSLCGMPLSGKQQCVCGECMHNRFEQAVLSREDHLNMPESVAGRIALWKFDKGWYLQDLLHDLKYKRLTGVGVDLGVALGARILESGLLTGKEIQLLPVPLHPRKRKMRGYNQSYYIGKGMQSVLKCERISIGAIERVKNTRTQTGFSLEKRRANIAQAFCVHQEEAVQGKDILIVDDVFTTGATSFELADTLRKAGARSVYIATVAQA